MHDEVRQMNKDFGPANISFTLRKSQWVVDPVWARSSDQSKRAEMYSWLHRGGRASLNVYFVKDYPRSAAESTMPHLMERDSQDHSADGILIGKDMKHVPHLLSHETGHWIGLFHTFAKAEIREVAGEDFSEDGDFIDDTPPLPDGLISKDKHREWHADNIMSYAWQEGAKFTPGQIARMRSLWTRFRARDANVGYDFGGPCAEQLQPIQPAPDSGSRMPFYPSPSNQRLAFEKCVPHPGVEELREEYCGTELFCHRRTYEHRGLRYSSPEACMDARKGQWKKMPWVEPLQSAGSLSQHLSKQDVLEVEVGTQRFCELVERKRQDQRLPGYEGVFGDTQECVDAHEAFRDSNESL